MLARFFAWLLRAFARGGGQLPNTTPAPAPRPAPRPAKVPMGTFSSWMGEAMNWKGVREVPGPKHAPEIMAWAKQLEINYPNDETPWCGLFVAYCLRKRVPGDVQPKNPLLARNWASFGEPVEPCYGSVLVFWRGHPHSGQGHVGFYVGEDGTHYHVLGGNQGNMVNISRIARERLITARWPKTTQFVPNRALKGGTGKADVTTNEA